MKPLRVFIALSLLGATVQARAAEPAPAAQSAAQQQDASPAEAKPDGPRKAADPVKLGTTQITGNRELPRVLYVVPWKRADLGEMSGRPAKSLLDEVLAPVDRDVFRRQMRYHDALQPDKAVAAGVEAAGDEPRVER
jgi:hypothetical protein